MEYCCKSSITGHCIKSDTVELFAKGAVFYVGCGELILSALWFLDIFQVLFLNNIVSVLARIWGA